ncbi:TlpA family protein disulfide reductase, partial [bacterium]|nr:TlpA family protein disulfide reductase [bacterium]
MKKKTSILLFVLFLSPLLLANKSSDDMIGKKAPMISGKKAIGMGLLKLSNLMTEIGYEKDKNGRFIEKDGKYVLQVKKNVVVLNFFSTKCVPCVKEIPAYNRLAEKYKNHPVKMIYVNVDATVNNFEMERFIARKQIKVPMMLPNQNEAMKKYKAFLLPRMVIINREGKIAEIFTGF